MKLRINLCDENQHEGKTPAVLHIPHVFPAFNRMYPPSPQDDPQEFLIFQASQFPTKRTAWLIEDPQLLKTPELYRLQLVASTVTDKGLL